MTLQRLGYWWGIAAGAQSAEAAGPHREREMDGRTVLGEPVGETGCITCSCIAGRSVLLGHLQALLQIVHARRHISATALAGRRAPCITGLQGRSLHAGARCRQAPSGHAVCLACCTSGMQTVSPLSISAKSLRNRTRENSKVQWSLPLHIRCLSDGAYGILRGLHVRTTVTSIPGCNACRRAAAQ